MIKVDNVEKPFVSYMQKVIPLAFNESLSYYEIIASYPNCEPISTETLGTAFREKDYTVDMAIFWLSRIPFAADF